MSFESQDIQEGAQGPAELSSVEFASENDCDPQQVEVINNLVAQIGELTVMVTGRPRMGKSTVFNNLFQLHLEAAPGAKSITKSVVVSTTTSQHGVQIRYIDTPGLEAADVDSKKFLDDMKVKLAKGADNFTLLYCISVTNTFDRSDVNIIKNLTTVFGPAIWKRCVLVLTRCDTLRAEDYAGDDQVEGYKECLQSFLEEFGEILIKCKVEIPSMKLIFDNQNAAVTPDADAIVAVPVAKTTEAGKDPSILPGFNTSGGQNWSDYVFCEIVKKSGKMEALALIKLRYNIIPLLGGALVGAGGGAAIGAIGGPLGAATGGAVGAVTGAISALPVRGLLMALKEYWRKEN